MSIETRILGSLQRIPLTSFLEFRQLVDTEILQREFGLIQTAQITVQALNIVLYFAISVENQLKINNFQLECRQKLFDFYLSSNLELKIQQYALLCSNILGLQLEKCVHMIYFLIYGRYASGPYVYALCHKDAYQERKREVFKIPVTVRRQNNSKNSEFGFKSELSIENPTQKSETTKQFHAELLNVLKPGFNYQEFTLKERQTGANKCLRAAAKKLTEIVKGKTQQFVTTRIQNHQRSAIWRTRTKQKTNTSYSLKKGKIKSQIPQLIINLKIMDQQIPVQTRQNKRKDRVSDTFHANFQYKLKRIKTDTIEIQRFHNADRKNNIARVLGRKTSSNSDIKQICDYYVKEKSKQQLYSNQALNLLQNGYLQKRAEVKKSYAKIPDQNEIVQLQMKPSKTLEERSFGQNLSNFKRKTVLTKGQYKSRMHQFYHELAQITKFTQLSVDRWKCKLFIQ